MQKYRTRTISLLQSCMLTDLWPIGKSAYMSLTVTMIVLHFIRRTTWCHDTLAFDS